MSYVYKERNDEGKKNTNFQVPMTADVEVV